MLGQAQAAVSETGQLTQRVTTVQAAMIVDLHIAPAEPVTEPLCSVGLGISTLMSILVRCYREWCV